VHRFGPECGALYTGRMPHLDVYPAYAPAFGHLPDILTWSQIACRTLKGSLRAALGDAFVWGIPRPTCRGHTSTTHRVTGEQDT
jgi:hypothetical protein